MNQAIEIGNLTKDPTMSQTQGGDNVCRFTVAVNRPKKNGQDNGADYFNVSVFRQQADNCMKYLTKGSKVCVTGPVSASTFQGQDGNWHASLNMVATSVEFLSSKNDNNAAPQQAAPAPQQANSTAGFTAVETEELPF